MRIANTPKTILETRHGISIQKTGNPIDAPLRQPARAPAVDHPPARAALR
ncbi:hypothetical protein [Burkholderia pyrrocinia]|nr:hypothetical protein [Burkholderia pyrrocinia]